MDFTEMLLNTMGFPGDSDGKESVCNAGHLGSILAWKDPTPVFLPGEFHGQSMGSQRVTKTFTLLFTLLNTLEHCAHGDTTE